MRETEPRERRVALVPQTVARLVQQQHEVTIERGAGLSAAIDDEQYRAAGANLVEQAADALRDADVVLKVQPPTADQIPWFRRDAVLISLMQPHQQSSLLAALAAGGITALALELVPRTTKAQSMDVLSSQATVAGYRAVLAGTMHLGRFLPMLTTAAGTITPAKVFVIGAGVAGLQAIATARRLGAVVTAFDVRPAVKEQIESLGARFVEAGASAEGTGGYAKELSDDQQARVLEAIAGHVKDIDLIITTAAIPGRAAPILITTAMLATMRPGSVVVDVAAETGGNCEATVAGEERVVHGVTVLGPLNLASGLPYHASFMLSKNFQSLLDHGVSEGQFRVSTDDPILGPMCVTHAGAVRFGVA